jgi:hypothetical protein
LFPQQGKGVVDGKTSNLPLDLTKDKSGKQMVAPVEAWGEIGVGIKAYDRMTGTSNIYSVNEIQLKVDGEEVYHSIMDAFSFDDTRYLNTYIDWTEWIENNSFYMKSFTDSGNFLGLNRSFSNGIIAIDEEREYYLEYTLKDIYGNNTRLTFSVKGKRDTIPPLPEADAYFRFNKDNRYAGKGVELKIPRKNLYTNLCLNVDTVNAYSPFAPMYVIGERIPLHSYCSVNLTVTNDSYLDKTKYGIVQIYKNKKTWIGGHYGNGQINAQIRELGSFSIEPDTIPPLITPVNPTKWEMNKRISFKITDDLSGIESYRGTLGGEFILFEYDAKTNSLFCVYDYKRMKSGRQALKLVVMDGAGNQAEINSQIEIH